MDQKSYFFFGSISQEPLDRLKFLNALDNLLLDAFTIFQKYRWSARHANFGVGGACSTP